MTFKQNKLHAPLLEIPFNIKTEIENDFLITSVICWLYVKWLFKFNCMQIMYN